MDITLRLDGVQEGEKYILEVCVKKGKTTYNVEEKQKVVKEPKIQKKDDLASYVSEEEELMKLNIGSDIKVESNLNFGK